VVVISRRILRLPRRPPARPPAPVGATTRQHQPTYRDHRRLARHHAGVDIRLAQSPRGQDPPQSPAFRRARPHPGTQVRRKFTSRRPSQPGPCPQPPPPATESSTS